MAGDVLIEFRADDWRGGVEVNATFELSGSDLEITISDEGEGFDPAKVSDPLNPQNLMKTSGRGIFYMKTFMDEVRFSRADGGGMEIVLTKDLAQGNQKEGS